jgi:hypothetical protein
MMVTMLYESRLHRGLISAGVGALVMAGEFVGELLLRHAFNSGWREPQMALAANSVGGLVGAMLVYRLLSFGAQRERLRKELNHRIRNALQPIAYCAPRLEGPERQIVETSVFQIDTCLKESLLTESPEMWNLARRKELAGTHDHKTH